jgi:hypothetical protein
MAIYQLEMESDGRFSSENFRGHATPLISESGDSAGSVTFYDIVTYGMRDPPDFHEFFRDLDVYVFIIEEK